MVGGVDAGAAGKGYAMFGAAGGGDEGEGQVGEAVEAAGADGQEEGELVTGESGGDAAVGGGELVQGGRDGGEELVADAVAVGVVDGFEPVEVDQDEREALPLEDPSGVAGGQAGALGIPVSGSCSRA